MSVDRRHAMESHKREVGTIAAVTGSITISGSAILTDGGSNKPPTPPNRSSWRDWLDLGIAWKAYSYGKAVAGVIDWVANNLLRGAARTA